MYIQSLRKNIGKEEKSLSLLLRKRRKKKNLGVKRKGVVVYIYKRYTLTPAFRPYDFYEDFMKIKRFFSVPRLNAVFFHLTSSSCSRCIKQFFLNIFPLNKLKWSNNVCSRRVIHARFLDLLFFFISSFFSFFSQVVCTS